MSGGRGRAIIFDLDGTLVDSAGPITAALNALRARRGGAPIERARTRGWISLGAKPLVANALAEYSGDPDADLAEFRDIYGAIASSPADLYPRVWDTLIALRVARWRMAICTDKPEALARKVVEGAGIAPLFGGLVGGRSGRPAKPDPAPVREAMRMIDAGPADCVYVGDSETDAGAAAALGVPLLLATYGYPIGDRANIACAARFDDFSEVSALAERFAPAAARAASAA